MAAGTLISPLSSGFSDAPNGTAYAYRRGTSRGQSVTMYSDPDATVSLGTSEALNAAGRLKAYVTEEAEIVVFDADGVEVFEFETGHNAEMVSMESLAFTGTKANGKQGAGGVVGLTTALTRFLTSFGTTDGKVIPDGQAAASNLKDLLASQAGLPFYDVTDSAYGAVGDDSTDNKTPIQKAIDAANTAGGGIVFLPVDSNGGTYRVASTVTLKKNVHLKMAPGARIKAVWGGVDLSEGVVVVNVGDTTESGCVIEGGKIETTQSAPPACILAAANSVGLVIRDIEIVHGQNNIRGINLSSNTRAMLINVVADEWIYTGSNNILIGCVAERFAMGDYSFAIGGQVTDKFFPNGATNWTGAIATRATGASTGTFASTANILDYAIGFDGNAFGGTAAGGRYVSHQSLNLSEVRNVSSPASYTPEPDKGRNYVQSNNDITIANPDPEQKSDVLFLSILNSKGSAQTITYGSKFLGADTSNATGKTLQQIFSYDSTLDKWLCWSQIEIS